MFWGTSRLVEPVYEHQESLVECFEETEVTSKQCAVISQDKKVVCFKLEQSDFNFG